MTTPPESSVSEVGSEGEDERDHSLVQACADADADDPGDSDWRELFREWPGA